MGTFLTEYLGCKVNSYEINAIINLFLHAGYVPFKKETDLDYPDVIVINTCAVTETSVSKDRKVIRRYRKEYPSSILVVMGCYAQYGYKFIQEELGADIVLGTEYRKEIVELVEKYKNTKNKIVKIEENNLIKTYENLSIEKDYYHTRAYVKIQDGCNKCCSYCLIPYIRGRSRSRKKDEIIAEIGYLLKNGTKEIVLTGIDMSSYGMDKNDNYLFSNLLQDILENFPELYCLRISSIEESQIDDLFLKLFEKYENLASHMHIPLQSGSNTVLKRMNRRYSLDSFKSTIETLRKIRPEISITTDLIVGFPEESDEEFNETYEFCKNIKFSKIHCFPYSIRPKTPAARMKQVDKKIVKERMNKMLNLSDSLEQKFFNKFIDQEVDVLVETYDDKAKVFKGHSSNYLEFNIDSKNKDIDNKVIKIKIGQCQNQIYSM